ncbi:hypothetical protein AVEN_45396-1 [Araneus ventricosus]|uniref:Uncharacterized protein n=1 Tax=Araneus ventricosus TaxID=182803 RepID=A0A4Y2NX66_ARAVE|nr:hypothetical protein AVEN_45396-1 [Araneus ventricosus]
MTNSSSQHLVNTYLTSDGRSYSYTPEFPQTYIHFNFQSHVSPPITMHSFQLQLRPLIHPQVRASPMKILNSWEDLTFSNDAPILWLHSAETTSRV